METFFQLRKFFSVAVGMTGESSLLHLKSSEDLHIYHLCICVCG